MSEERGRVEREREAALERERRRERERAEAAERLARQREAAAQRHEHEIAERARAEREQQARLAAIREAEIERVRLEAQARAEREVRERELAHRLELERQRAATRANGRRLALVTSAVLGIGSAIGAVGIYFGYHRAEVTHIGASHEQELSRERERVARLERNLKAERDRFENAQRALDRRSAATPEPAAPSTRPETRGGKPPVRAPRTGSVENERPCRGDPNDPLNPCLNP